jgi:hypothetical protein
MAPARGTLKGKTVLVDTLGNKIPLPAFEDIGMLSEGLLAVRKNKKWGYADIEGKIKIPCAYDFASPFESGFAKIKKGKLVGVIDSTGAIVVDPLYEELLFKNKYFVVTYNGQTGLLLSNGAALIAPEYSRIEFLTDRIAAVYKGEQCRYFNLTTGKIISVDTQQ